MVKSFQHCDEQTLKIEELQDSAAALAGHHNPKQRIHHIEKLKSQLCDSNQVGHRFDPKTKQCVPLYNSSTPDKQISLIRKRRQASHRISQLPSAPPNLSWDTRKLSHQRTLVQQTLELCNSPAYDIKYELMKKTWERKYDIADIVNMTEKLEYVIAPDIGPVPDEKIKQDEEFENITKVICDLNTCLEHDTERN